MSNKKRISRKIKQVDAKRDKLFLKNVFKFIESLNFVYNASRRLGQSLRNLSYASGKIELIPANILQKKYIASHGVLMPRNYGISHTHVFIDDAEKVENSESKNFSELKAKDSWNKYFEENPHNRLEEQDLLKTLSENFINDVSLFRARPKEAHGKFFSKRL